MRAEVVGSVQISFKKTQRREERSKPEWEQRATCDKQAKKPERDTGKEIRKREGAFGLKRGEGVQRWRGDGWSGWWVDGGQC